jgi:hypothetical protein
MPATTTKSKSKATARKRLARATKADLQQAAYPPAVGGGQSKPEADTTLSTSIPFAFLFLNRH